MRRLSFLLLAFAVLTASASAADELLKLTVGGRASIKLSENPSTGYSWKIDPAKSANLGILQIDDAGFVRPSGHGPVVGAPGIHKWRVKALRPGRATIGFVYRRPWESRPARTHRVKVQVKPR